jgi:hypothetical protein
MNLRPRFARLSPGRLKISKKHIANVKSLVFGSLHYLENTDGRSFKAPLLAAWVQLFQLLTSSYDVAAIRSIARLASARGLEPSQIDDAFSSELLLALENEGLNKKPRIVHQNAIRFWNQLVRSTPGWPQTVLIVPKYGTTYVLPWSAFRSELVVEIESYLVRCTTHDPFEIETPLKVWRPATIATYRNLIRRYLSLVVRSGFDPRQLCRIVDIVDAAMVERAFSQRGLRTQLDGRATAASMVQVVVQMAAFAARSPNLDREAAKRCLAEAEKLRSLAVRLRTVREKSKKNRDRLSPLRNDAVRSIVSSCLNRPPS